MRWGDPGFGQPQVERTGWGEDAAAWQTAPLHSTAADRAPNLFDAPQQGTTDLSALALASMQWNEQSTEWAVGDWIKKTFDAVPLAPDEAGPLTGEGSWPNGTPRSRPPTPDQGPRSSSKYRVTTVERWNAKKDQEDLETTGYPSDENTAARREKKAMDKKLQRLKDRNPSERSSQAYDALGPGLGKGKAPALVTPQSEEYPVLSGTNSPVPPMPAPVQPSAAAFGWPSSDSDAMIVEPPRPAPVKFGIPKRQQNGVQSSNGLHAYSATQPSQSTQRDRQPAQPLANGTNGHAHKSKAMPGAPITKWGPPTPPASVGPSPQWDSLSPQWDSQQVPHPSYPPQPSAGPSSPVRDAYTQVLRDADNNVITQWGDKPVSETVPTAFKDEPRSFGRTNRKGQTIMGTAATQTVRQLAPDHTPRPPPARTPRAYESYPIDGKLLQPAPDRRHAQPAPQQRQVQESSWPPPWH